MHHRNLLKPFIMLSKFDFHCPCCDHKLNKNDEIHFLVKTGKKLLSKLRLNPVPGVYGYKSDHNLDIKNGDHVKFYCENCESNLQSIDHSGFVGIYLIVSKDITYELIFSPICGERITYVIIDGQIVKYGNDFLSIMSFKKKAG